MGLFYREEVHWPPLSLGSGATIFAVRRDCAIGVDLGGTNVRAQAFFSDGAPAGERVSRPSLAQSGTETIVRQIGAAIQDAIASAETAPAAVGMAIPGHIDDESGLVRWAPNFGEEMNGVFYNWTDLPLRELLGATVDLPIVMGNDANLAALGEYRWGSGEDRAKCLVLLTIGTGIGGGVVLGPSAVMGRAAGPLLLLGGNKGGAEIGHMILHHGGLDCNAGSYGAFEGYCQRDSIVQRAVHRLRRGRVSLVRDLVDDDLAAVTPKTLFDAAEAGDEMAAEVWQEVGTWLGVGIANCINVFAPDVVAIGGQIALAGDWLIEPARRSARNAAIPSLFADAKIVQAQQTEDAGMLGAAAVAFERMKWTSEIR
jgi:glucokinase